MTDEMHSLLSLPPATLVALGSGYLGYVLAFRGRDTGHQTHDVVFISLAFAAIAQVVQVTALPYTPVWGAALAGVMTTCLSSAAWRRFGQKLLHKALRSTQISIHDGHKTAWQSLIADDHMEPTQIEVHLKSGVVLYCDDTAQFVAAPYGPMLLGEDGSVALYLTHVKTPSEEIKDVKSTQSTDWGDEITHIRADEIARVSLRLLRR